MSTQHKARIEVWDKKDISLINMGDYPYDHKLPNEKRHPPEESARGIATLLGYHARGDVCDILYKAIADEIIPMLANEQTIEILKSEWDIQNRIRMAMNKLAKQDK